MVNLEAGRDFYHEFQWKFISKRHLTPVAQLVGSQVANF